MQANHSFTSLQYTAPGNTAQLDVYLYIDICPSSSHRKRQRLDFKLAQVAQVEIQVKLS